MLVTGADAQAQSHLDDPAVGTWQSDNNRWRLVIGKQGAGYRGQLHVPLEDGGHVILEARLTAKNGDPERLRGEIDCTPLKRASNDAASISSGWKNFWVDYYDYDRPAKLSPTWFCASFTNVPEFYLPSSEASRREAAEQRVQEEQQRREAAAEQRRREEERRRQEWEEQRAQAEEAAARRQAEAERRQREAERRRRDEEAERRRRLARRTAYTDSLVTEDRERAASARADRDSALVAAAPVALDVASHLLGEVGIAVGYYGVPLARRPAELGLGAAYIWGEGLVSGLFAGFAENVRESEDLLFDPGSPSPSQSEIEEYITTGARELTFTGGMYANVFGTPSVQAFIGVSYTTFDCEAIAVDSSCGEAREAAASSSDPKIRGYADLIPPGLQHHAFRGGCPSLRPSPFPSGLSPRSQRTQPGCDDQPLSLLKRRRCPRSEGGIGSVEHRPGKL